VTRGIEVQAVHAAWLHELPRIQEGAAEGVGEAAVEHGEALRLRLGSGEFFIEAIVQSSKANARWTKLSV